MIFSLSEKIVWDNIFDLVQETTKLAQKNLENLPFEKKTLFLRPEAEFDIFHSQIYLSRRQNLFKR